MTAMDRLPTEINIRILSELPLTEVGARALARCSITGHSTLRSASLEPVIWKPHYGHRYAHSEIAQEAERRAKFQGNWREMYRERRRLDCEALDNLRALEACEPTTRIEYARRIVNLRLDVWDALSEVAHRPPPTLFQEDEDVQKVLGGSPLANLTRKYWAHELLKIIARRYAIDGWLSLKQYVSGEAIEPMSFEEAFANLSSFYGVLPDEIINHLDRETNGCRRYLDYIGTPYVPEELGFETRTLCNAVCAYLRSRGFGRADQMSFYNFRNSLPHVFMKSYRRTLPISLVFLFVAIMKRLGLEASPLNTPNCVTAIVRDTIVDVSRGTPNSIVGAVENYNEIREIFTPTHQAVLTTQMLARAARNITMAGALEYGTGRSDEDFANRDVSMWQQAQYLSKVLLVLFPAGPVESNEGLVSLMFEQKLFILDFELVIQDKLSEYFPTYAGLTVKDEDEERTTETDPAVSPPDDIFVGQIVSLKNFIPRCVTSWKVKNGQVICSTIASCHHYVDDFPMASLSPYLCTAGELKNFLQNPILGQFFEDAEFHESGFGTDRGRGRFIMNKRLMKLYPDEDARGARWVREA